MISPLKKKACTEIITKRLPILKWLPHYSLGYFFQDLLAGFTVTLTKIPQGIAYAIVAGLPPQYGLYSAIMGGVAYIILGGCKDINIGATAIMALFVQNSVIILGPAGAVLMTFITGALIFSAGVLHLGFLVEFFSFPVISGFTTASALTIASSQLRPLFGLLGPSGDFLKACITFFQDINLAQKWDTLLGIITILVLFGFRFIRRFGGLKYVPEWSKYRNIFGKIIFFVSLGANALVVMSGTTIAYVARKHYNSTPVVITGVLTAGLPPINLPPFNANFNGTYYSFGDRLSFYGTLIAFCPLVAFLGHIAIVKAFSKGKIIDGTQELLALGMANMLGSLVQSMPVTGSFTRTAVNNASGVRTQVSGLVTTCMILISLVLLTEVFQYIPKATLAAVIIVAMCYLCDFYAIIVMWRTKKIDLIPFFATLLCCLFISLEYGIIIGIGTSLIFVLYDSARPKLYFENLLIHDSQDDQVYLLKVKESLRFPCAEYIRNEILAKCSKENSSIILDGEFIKNIDGTVVNVFLNIQDDLKARNQKMIFLNFKQIVADACIGQNKNLVKLFKNGKVSDVIDYIINNPLK